MKTKLNDVLKPMGMPMKPELVRSSLAGVKTETRRVLPIDTQEALAALSRKPKQLREAMAALAAKSRYGPPGRQLWAREMHKHVERFSGQPCVMYADGRVKPKPQGAVGFKEQERFRPGIHMHEWASRCRMVTTEVRVERLQEMDETNARREGAPLEYHIHPWDWFIPLWDSLHAKQGLGFQDNPFVTVVCYKLSAPARRG